MVRDRVGWRNIGGEMDCGAAAHPKLDAPEPFAMLAPAGESAMKTNNTTTLWAARVVFAASLTVLATFALTGCGPSSTGPHKEAGPLPLSSPDKPIVLVVDKRSNFEQGEIKSLFWDEGSGPTLAADRVKLLVDSIPKELGDRLHSTRDVPANLYPPLRNSTGSTYEYLYDTWGIVVSLNPDVVIVSVYERPVGPHNRLPPAWDSMSVARERYEYLDKQVEFVTGTSELRIYAGALVPWSKEMYVFSTDPKVKNGPLTFENDHAEILLPAGKLILVRHDDDIAVTRE
jgi:hypothetical protein